VFQHIRPERRAEEVPGTGVLSSAQESPSPRRGEKGRKDDGLFFLIRFPRLGASGRSAAAPLHPRLHSDAPLGRKRRTAATKCAWTRRTDFLPRKELNIVPNGQWLQRRK
jgi:hypothetical protein